MIPPPPAPAPGKVSIKEDIVLPKYLIPWSVYCIPENLSLDALFHT